ncbi:uncharacterized protein LOC135216406 [Macrobrachium nipponense]|uniref:uncharacterized protein LOC135216406 n=1 Tax=Macrobrachium nipponense TaxID=159736 RepID=UPI0030C7E7DA
MAPQESSVSGEAEAPKRFQLKVNGINYTVGPDVLPWTTLVDYLREHLKLPGTKVLCREGGCGVCTVVATVSDAENEGAVKTFSVQACQVLVYACASWSIETIEHLGNRYKGYHSLQKALAGFYGTQCGYCSPGMIMTMYGQLKSSMSLTTSQVEKSLDANICRCTGYRPILDAFKSFTVDADPCLKERLADIEDSYKATCPKTGSACSGSCEGEKTEGNETPIPVLEEDLKWIVDGVQWFRPVTLMGISNILKSLTSTEKVRIVVGNTGQGVYKEDGPYSAYISTCGVKELYAVNLQSPLILGANVSLTRCTEVFEHMANNFSGYRHLQQIKDHWLGVANVSVRNMGSWAGNLMMKHQHREFPSDIFLTLLAADATLMIQNQNSLTPVSVSLERFLQMDMSRNIIVSMTLPPMPDQTKFCTFKITPRAVNAHAYVNACFKMEIDEADGYRVSAAPTILLGGINPTFMHAKKTENYLLNRRLTDVPTVVESAVILGNEVKPDSQKQDASPEYRISLARCLLYKAIVHFLGTKVSSDIISAGAVIERPLSTGQQDFDMNEDTWPVGKGLPKIESATQISGEALYMDDIPYLPNELHGAFVQTTVANAKIKSIDTADALAVPGVKIFIAAADIPGENSFVKNAGPFPDPVFVGDRVRYAGQPIGLVVADTRGTAVRAAKLVRVEYEDIQKPILTIEEALKQGRSELCENLKTGKREPQVFGDIESGFKDSKHKLIGELHQGTQFHLTLEAYASRVVPIEDGYDVFCTTQWPTETQAVISSVLNVPAHSVNVELRRIGGGYGGKISRQNVTAAAAAVAAQKLFQPVRVVLDLNTAMTMTGWREPYLSKYEVGFDDNGKFQALKVDVIGDAGHVKNDSAVYYLSGALQNCYYIPNMMYRPIIVTTDTAANTWCRTPGTVEALGTIEYIIEHIAHYLKKDPLEVRMANMVAPGVPRFGIPPHKANILVDDIMPLLKEKAQYERRKEEVAIFNKENKWRKRGITVIPLRYGLNYPSSFRYGVQIAIYEHDGTVAISHGGIEMGQGINTKVAQVVAFKLGVPMDLVIVKKSDTMVGANSAVTGGSFGSDLCAHGAKVACDALFARMNAVKERMKRNTETEPTWIELVKKCHAVDVDLCERYWTAGREHPDPYDIWAACCLEVEVDILTGQYLIRRADIVEDSGRSMNPYVDMGQVEGAFVMGLGLYTSEIVKFDEETGQKLSNGTWDYKPPTALDIPVDLRVTLLPNATNPQGVLSSKATGEPPLCLSFAFVTAVRQAIAAFRADDGRTDWFHTNTPLTVEAVHQLCGVRPDQFSLVTPADEVSIDDFQVVDINSIPEEEKEDSCSLA